jgi:hypothetical protein
MLPPLALGDDTNVVIPLGSPTCAPMSTFSFFGTPYDRFYVHSNGEVTFSLGAADFSPTLNEFHTQMPRISGMWTDLNPLIGGNVTVTTTSLAVAVNFNAVATFGAPAIVNSFRIEMDLANQCSIVNYAPSPSHNLDTLVGISNGSLGTIGPGVVWDALMGAGLQAGTPSDSVYQFTLASPVPNTSGFTRIDFLASDGSAYTVF